MDSENSSFLCGFLFGILVTAFMFFIGWAIRDSYINRDSEIMRVEYRNRNVEVSRQLVEDMVKMHFPSNVWENADYDCSKSRVKLELSNP